MLSITAITTCLNRLHLPRSAIAKKINCSVRLLQHSIELVQVMWFESLVPQFVTMAKIIPGEPVYLFHSRTQLTGSGQTQSIRTITLQFALIPEAYVRAYLVESSNFSGRER